MRLTYRGASYEYNSSPLEAGENPVLRQGRDASQRCQTLQTANYPLLYRGVRYTTEQVAAALSPTPAPQSTQVLAYRGIKYIKNPNGSVEMVAIDRSNGIPQTTMLVFKEVGRIHRENLRRNLAHRLEVAKDRGDQTLVSLLEAEFRQLAL
jgi:hypothetical protein